MCHPMGCGRLSSSPRFDVVPTMVGPSKSRHPDQVSGSSEQEPAEPPQTTADVLFLAEPFVIYSVVCAVLAQRQECLID